jgi:hypothetical protein
MAVNSKILAIVGVCVGVGLLAFGTPTGLPAIAGPAAAGFWPIIAIVCLILGLIGLAQGVDVRWRRDGESDDAVSTTHRQAPKAWRRSYGSWFASKTQS